MKKTNHHVRPQSREGTNHKSNITQVEGQLHQDFHRLFNNRTPQEILVFLVETFWKGRYSYLNEVVELNKIARRKKWIDKTR